MTSANTESAIAEAGMHLLHMFAAVCGAPDDQEIAQQANAALRDLDALLSAPADVIPAA